MSPVKKNSSNLKAIQMSNREMQINMSTLSTTQKKMCMQLLPEDNKDNDQSKDKFE